MIYLNRHSDEELLKLIARDDVRAFEVLFNRHWETAHRLAYSKLKCKEVTQELVQDLFLSFWERRHALKIGDFSHYLRVSVKYKVITFINQQSTLRKYFEAYCHQARKADSEETLETVEYNELMQALKKGVKGLPEKTQEVFRLNRFEGRSVPEIARELNLSEKAIEYHITRSRKELRLYLKDFLYILCLFLYDVFAVI